jgi:Coenzyme PQQ synthesis protein D (PqqD)
VSYMGEGPLARFKRVKRPVARDEGLLVERVADETVIYDEKSTEAHCLSPLAAVVFDHCDGHTTISELAVLATKETGEPVNENGVLEALMQLSDRDLLAVPPRGGLNRREMIGRSAAAAGGAFAGATLITSIVAPAALAAASATCAEVLCCGCCTNTWNKQECCTTPNTNNCQCVQASQGQRPGPTGNTVSGGKFCKTTSTSAPTDAECLALKPPSGWLGAGGTCGPFQQDGASGAHCANCA